MTCKKNPTPEELRIRRKKAADYHKKYRARLKAQVVEILGNKCFFNTEHNGHVAYHRMDGKSHRQTDTYILILRETNPKEEWVCLCNVCHRGVHFCMRMFGWTWDEVVGHTL